MLTATTSLTGPNRASELIAYWFSAGPLRVKSDGKVSVGSVASSPTSGHWRTGRVGKLRAAPTPQ
jgi:hypothetical protein